jgi:hypothetical protein
VVDAAVAVAIAADHAVKMQPQQHPYLEHRPLTLQSKYRHQLRTLQRQMESARAAFASRAMKRSSWFVVQLLHL